MRQVQSVQNADARLIARAKRREHLTRQLHWLNLAASVVYQVLSSKIPIYLAEDFHVASESSARSPRFSAGKSSQPTENIHDSDGLRRIMTFFDYRAAPYKYSYLLTYLPLAVR